MAFVPCQNQRVSGNIPATSTALRTIAATANGQQAFYRQIARLDFNLTAAITQRPDEVSCPDRIGSGEHDLLAPASQASQLADALPSTVEIILFPGSGHVVPVEAPEALEKDGSSWLTIKRVS